VCSVVLGRGFARRFVEPFSGAARCKGLGGCVEASAMSNEPEAIPVEGPEARPDPETPVDRLMKKTPWWAISTAGHVALALIFGYIIVLSRPLMAEEPVSVKPRIPDKTREPEFQPREDKVPATMDIPDTPVQADMKIDREKPESDEDDWHREMKGQSEEFMTRDPFNSPNRNVAIGAGGGGAGRKGGPFGGRYDHGGRGARGATKTTEDAVLAALRWLARHQGPDGSWGVQGHLKTCGAKLPGTCAPNPSTAHDDFDAGVSGLAILAFLGAGYSHLSKDTYDGICFGDVVRRGIQWMITHQDAEGCIGSRTAHKHMYNHAICALALVEAHGLTGSALFKENAQRAVDYLVAAQNAGKGWRYAERTGENDTSVTGWAVMALKSAELSSLRFPRSAYDGVRSWLDEVTEESYYRAGYTFRGTGKVFCEHNESFNHHEALSAIGAMARVFMDHRSDARVKGAVGLCLQDLPAWRGKDIDFYYWYYASLALFQVEGGSGANWKRWNDALTEALVKPQNRADTGCKFGSWEPIDRWSCEGGRVYATAINALTLEVYYRYESVFTGRR
jgi:hypothetical protein